MSQSASVPVKTNVFVLYTGGTIGMGRKDANNPASPLIPLARRKLEKYVKGLGQDEGIHWDIVDLVDDKGKKVEPVDSSEVNSGHWEYMAAAI